MTDGTGARLARTTWRPHQQRGYRPGRVYTTGMRVASVGRAVGRTVDAGTPVTSRRPGAAVFSRVSRPWSYRWSYRARPITPLLDNERR